MSIWYVLVSESGLKFRVKIERIMLLWEWWYYYGLPVKASSELRNSQNLTWWHSDAVIQWIFDFESEFRNAVYQRQWMSEARKFDDAQRTVLYQIRTVLYQSDRYDRCAERHQICELLQSGVFTVYSNRNLRSKCGAFFVTYYHKMRGRHFQVRSPLFFLAFLDSSFFN